MRAWPRLFLCAAACLALLTGFGWAFARWQGAAMADWDLSAAARSLLAEQRRDARLTARDAVSVRCVNGKRDVTAALLAGRLTLREAVAKFRLLDEEARADRGDPPRPSAGDEAVLQNVMNWVSVAAAGRPNEAAIRARLAAERDAILHAAPNGL
jgi:hypothetical protein